MIAAVVLLAAAGVAGRGTLVDTGYRQMYNLQFDQAHRTFAAYEKEHPNDPIGPISNAAAYLFAEFDRLKILQSEFFVNDSNFRSSTKLTPDPAVKKAFEEDLSRGDRLIQAALQRNAADRDAVFANIMRLGLHADYLALIEKRYLASLSEVKLGRAMAEDLIAKDPTYYDAYLAIAVENYLLSLKPAPVRLLLRMGGAQTDKETGVAKLRVTAEKGRYLQPYARLLLAVAALRDQRREEAKSLLQGLVREFPQNQLYSQELSRMH